jgi:hypothetical protein
MTCRVHVSSIQGTYNTWGCLQSCPATPPPMLQLKHQRFTTWSSIVVVCIINYYAAVSSIHHKAMHVTYRDVWLPRYGFPRVSSIKDKVPGRCKRWCIDYQGQVRCIKDQLNWVSRTRYMGGAQAPMIQQKKRKRSALPRNIRSEAKAHGVCSWAGSWGKEPPCALISLVKSYSNRRAKTREEKRM